MSLRASFDTADPEQMADCFRDFRLGEFLSYVISRVGYTETGIAVVANVSTLAAVPTALFQCVIATTGAAGTGVKTLLKGPITGQGALVPAPGECVWDGGVRVLFNVVDAALTASFTYATVLTNVASITLRNLGQTDQII